MTPLFDLCVVYLIVFNREPEKEEEEDADFIGAQPTLSMQEQFLGMLDPLTAENFAEEFEAKYGKVHPNFFNGTCQQAVAQSRVGIRSCIFTHIQ
jgi:hypothetical protein